jgi:transglutaminase-like putative cysteine protease
MDATGVTRTWNTIPFMATTSQFPAAPPHGVGERVQRYFELSLFAMVTTGFVSLAGTGRLDAFSVLFVLAALGGRAFLFATQRTALLSVAVTSRLTVAYIAFYFLDLFFVSGTFIGPLIHLVLFIMVVKLFSAQTERDHIYLALIAFMMILASAVLTVDSFFLAAFALFLLLTVTTAISMEMRRSLRDSALNNLQVAGGSGAGISHSVSVAGGALVVGILIVSAGIFFMLPRISSNYLSRFAAQSSFASGFSNEVTLGEIGRIQQLDTVVMHVEFTQKPAVLPADLKWRGISLNNFDGRHWRNTTSGWTVRSSADRQLYLQTDQFKGLLVGGLQSARQPGEAVHYRITMQPLGMNVVFVLPVAYSIDAGPPRDFAIDGSGSISLVDPTRQVRIYNGDSRLEAPTAGEKISDNVDIPARVAEQYLQLPLNLDPRIAQVAASETRDAASVYAKAAAIEAFLQNRFGYTLEMQDAPDGRDPLSYFLFVRKQGHCEYFSSAMAVMLRTQGIPSRVINGFRNGEYNDVSGRYIIRARDAHSWVEAYIPGYGWATFDPTPAAILPGQTSWSRMMLYVDAMRDFWNDWIINYDFAHQETLSQKSLTQGRQYFEELQQWWKTKYRGALDRVRGLNLTVSQNPQAVGWRATGIVLLLALLLNVRRVIRWMRDAALARRPRQAPRAAATIWYERMTRTLNKRGVQKSPQQTPREFVQSIETEPLRHSVERFTDSYERARFGASEEGAESLPGLFEEVEASARR